MNWLDTVTDPANVAAALAGVACFATVLSVASPMFQTNQLGARLKAVSERREELRRKSRAALEKKATLRQTQTGFVNDMVQRFDLQKALKDDSLQMKMMQAGLRGPRPVSMFYFARAALPIGFAIAAFLYLTIMGEKLGLNGSAQLLIVTVAAAAGFYGPNIYLTNVIAKRRDAIMQAFPDTLDMLLICVESGMSIEMALQRVGQEIAASSIELAEELALTCAELSYLPERRMAYENLARRTNHPGVKSVAMALTQAERYGTPLGSALRVMAKENRELRLSAAEKKAAALPPKLTVPMIIFFLPVLMMVILGPAMIQIMAMLDK
ncbi:MAG: type II secretion system F family protein [Alphaproteobacteria bacterium]|nr:type II secretion system F family protein [Alphaproteobacteria bacterium]